MSEILKFAENELQLAALATMAVVYTLRIRWLLKFNAGKERQAPTGTGSTEPKGSIIYSWANIAMPWAMESTRKNFFLYIQFVLFHIGVAVSITMSFIIPYLPSLMENILIVRLIQVSMGLACLIGCYRILRRITNPVMRKISSPDDYFSVLLLTVWFFFAVMAAPNRFQNGEFWLMGYFALTAFFLVYVPFSKISHYLYYPFTRYYFGKSMGRRGVFPIVRSKRQQPTASSGN